MDRSPSILSESWFSSSTSQSHDCCLLIIDWSYRSPNDIPGFNHKFTQWLKSRGQLSKDAKSIASPSSSDVNAPKAAETSAGQTKAVKQNVSNALDDVYQIVSSLTIALPDIVLDG